MRSLLGPCRRRGTEALLGLTSDNWCAAFASSSMTIALKPGEVPPHRYRAAVAELIADARDEGAWHDVSELRAGPFVPCIGDLVCFLRGGHDPRGGGEGHVGRVEVFDRATGRLVTIDGNHENRVARVERRVGDFDLVGVIAYPSG